MKNKEALKLLPNIQTLGGKGHFQVKGFNVKIIKANHSE
jgi:hypothetical protein